MRKPLVAIVGRPNVGKSTFFNKICGKRISIVEDTPGVTRDRIYGEGEWCGYNFSIVDTGGMDFRSDDVFNGDILSQAQIAVDLADVIVFMVDGREGLCAKDHDVANYLRRCNKPCVLVVNKLDRFEVENTYEFYELGIGEPYPISCEQAKGLGEVLDAIVEHLPRVDEDEASKALKIAIVGRPNAGKSSLTNALIGESRVIVSDVAGTTRDAIDTPFRYDGKDYILIDTAGMRKSKSVDYGTVESYSVIRSMEAIKRADVVLIVIDATQPVSEQDVRICGYVHEEGKPSVVVMNKWDTVNKDDKTINKYKKMLDEKLAFMDYYQPLFISALTKKRVGDVMPMVEQVYAHASHRISTGVINQILQEAIMANEPPMRNGRKLKINYATQASTNPPTFIFFCNDPELAHFSYIRYLENRIRTSVDFSGTPIKLVMKGKDEKDI